MTLSLINSNNDSNFVGWVTQNSLSILFSQCKISLCWRNIKYMILVAFWHWWKLLQDISTNDNERNLCQDFDNWKLIDLDLRVHVLHYILHHANELLVRVRLSFQKNLQIRQTSRNSKKLSKRGLVMIKHCLKNSQINSILWSREFSYVLVSFILSQN